MLRNLQVYYAPTLFGTLELESELGLGMSGLLESVQLFGVLFSIGIMNHFGRGHPFSGVPS